ncbi:hypothetical protein [Microbacterium capsulatum]|uniref:Capsular polysaccharide biosynthesis protein n=1 Tax=Microbacterium capsulatum TaxID=3041921 RepID=A0ABU0XH97_9MICO|nr:hypothetical protein [Microbacterium sp. ASV81]MDQ4214267.1 hypothetical protein [Microbacterium sp. ASV81]
MTVREALSAMGRRWYVLLAIVLVFAGLSYLFYKDGGSYATQTTVTFTLPSRSTLLPESGSTDISIIAFAGAVATSINQGKPVETFSDANAPYYGAGVRQGVMVSLRNTGNQWISSFPSATIDIQIVGRTRQWVLDRQQEALKQIIDVTAAQQAATITPVSDRITATVEPLSTDIQHVTPGRSELTLAGAAMVLAGFITGCSAAVIVDRSIRSRRRRRALKGVDAPTPGARTGGRFA